MPGPPRHLLLDLGLLWCAAIWGASFYLVKDALSGVHPITLVAYRFALSALLLAPLVFYRGRVLRHLPEGAVLAFWLCSLYISQTLGLARTTASNSGFITGLFLLFVPLFLFAFARQRPAPGLWAAVAVALAGLWLLTGGIRGFNKGDAVTLVSAAAYAAHLLATDRYMKEDADPALLAFHQFWMTGAACLLLAFCAGRSLEVATRRAAALVAFLALLPTVAAFFVQMIAQRRVSPLKVSLIFALEPVFAALFAWTLGGEPLRARSALGGGLIVTATLLAERLGRSPSKTA